jgi:hypothetical protein
MLSNSAQVGVPDDGKMAVAPRVFIAGETLLDRAGMVRDCRYPEFRYPAPVRRGYLMDWGAIGRRRNGFQGDFRYNIYREVTL